MRVAPILVRQVPYTVAKLAGYEVISQHLRNPLAAGVLAGSAAAVVSQPGDVVLARLCGGSAQARLTGVACLEDARSARCCRRLRTRPAPSSASTRGHVACALVCASRLPLQRAGRRSALAHRLCVVVAPWLHVCRTRASVLQAAERSAYGAKRASRWPRRLVAPRLPGRQVNWQAARWAARAVANKASLAS